LHTHKAERKRGAARAEMVDRRSIMLIGQTGAGKSWIGNLLMGKDGNKDWYDGAGAGKQGVFMCGPGLKSCTQTIQSNICSHWKIYDTPGLGDTEAASIKHLNHIMTTLKSTEVHMILLVVSAGQKLTAAITESTRCLGECLKPGIDSKAIIDPTRVIVLLNQINQDEDSEEYKPWLDEQRAYCQKGLAAAIGIDSPEELNVIPVALCRQGRKGSADREDGIRQLTKELNKFAARKPEQMKTTCFRTWSEVLLEAYGLKDERIKSEEWAKKKMKTIEDSIDALNEKVENCETALKAACGTAIGVGILGLASIPFGGQGAPAAAAAAAAADAAAVALAVAVKSCEEDMPGLKKQLKESKAGLPGYEAAVEQAKRFLADLTTYQTVMGCFDDPWKVAQMAKEK